MRPATRATVAPEGPAEELARAIGLPTDAVSTSALVRVAASVDASHFHSTPRAVVTPRSADDVAAVLRHASGTGRHVTFRSGGTSLSGQSVASDLLVDTRRAFQRIAPSADGATVRVEPGATVRAVNRRLAPLGRMLGPDPASEVAATIGGVVANNSSGMACGTVHNAYATLESIRVVLPSGTVVDTSRRDADARLAASEPALHAGLARLREDLLADPALVAEVARQYRGKNTMGYSLNALVDHAEPVQVLAHLMVGSEGTLGFIADVELATVPLPRVVSTALLVLDDLSAATAALPALVAAGVPVVELMDAASLRVAGGDPAAPAVLRGLRPTTHAALLLEFRAEDDGALAAQVTAAAAALAATGGPQLVTTDDPAERRALWRVRKGLYAAVAGARPAGTTALLEDVAVPVEHLASTCRSLQMLFATHGFDDAVVFGHARDGNIHFLVAEDFRTDAGTARHRAFTADLVDLVLGVGGTLKAEHGTGRIMAPFVERQFGSELYAVMRQLKQLCDPHGVLGPGVVIGDDAEAHLRDLKVTPGVEEEVDRCVECGYCEPVCPSRALTLTPRERIVVRRARAAARAAGDDELDAELGRGEAYASLQTCAVDGMCATACPVGIDTGDLVRRLRAQEAPAPARRAGAAAAANWDVATRAAGRALDLAGRVPPGLARGATRAGRALLSPEVVPAWSPDLPSGGERRSLLGPGSPTPDVVLLPSCVGSVFGPAGDEEDGIGAAAALWRLCERAGLRVGVPDGVDELCCGTPWKSKGLQEGHAHMARLTTARLLEATDGGRIPVVTDSTSCSEGLLAAEGDAGTAVRGALQVHDALAFVAAELLPALADHLAASRPLDTLVLHPTCSGVRQGLDGALRTVAAAVATDVVVPAAWGCCAFAGDRGLLHPELTASATAAEAAEVAGMSADAFASSNRTCEIGMSRATGRTYRHVVELLEERTRPAAAADARPQRPRTTR